MTGPKYVPCPENADDTEAARVIEQGLLEELDEEPDHLMDEENSEWIPF